jgi:hypothetical protein
MEVAAASWPIPEANNEGRWSFVTQAERSGFARGCRGRVIAFSRGKQREHEAALSSFLSIN